MHAPAGARPGVLPYPVHYLAGQVGASHAAHLIATRTNAIEKPVGWTWISVWAIRAAFIVLGLFHVHQMRAYQTTNAAAPGAVCTIICTRSMIRNLTCIFHRATQW